MDLVLYEPSGQVSYAPEVAAAATMVSPLFGLAGLFAKVMASRTQSKRLDREIARDRHEHRERVLLARQAADASRTESDRAFALELRRVVAIEERSSREYDLAVQRLERSYDAAVFDIEARSATTRFAIKEELSARLRGIDATLELGLEQVKLTRYRTDEAFRLAHRELDMQERDTAEIIRAMRSAERQARSRSQVVASLGAEMVVGLSRALTLRATQHPRPVEFLLGTQGALG